MEILYGETIHGYTEKYNKNHIMGQRVRVNSEDLDQSALQIWAQLFKASLA